MKFLSKLAALFLVFAFAANAECAAFCFSAVPSEKAAHPCCDQHKKSPETQRCSNKAPLADYLLVESANHVEAPPFAFLASFVFPALSAIVEVSHTGYDCADPPDPARTIIIRRI